jgi:hypothetical protein
LLAIDGIESGVAPKTECSVEEAPRRDCLLEGKVVTEDDDSGGKEQEPAYESDEVWCDPLWDQTYNKVPVRLESIIHPGVLARFVFVVAEGLQTLWSNKLRYFH